NTFIAGSGGILEVTPQGNVVYEHNLLGDIGMCQKLGNGRIVYQTGWIGSATGLESIHEIEPLTGRKTTNSAVVKHSKLSLLLECLPGGHYLWQGSTGVFEVDSSGKIIWQYPGGSGALRLPNGNTLLEGKDRLLEVDRAGNTLWEAPLAG